LCPLKTKTLSAIPFRTIQSGGFLMLEKNLSQQVDGKMATTETTTDLPLAS